MAPARNMSFGQAVSLLQQWTPALQGLPQPDRAPQADAQSASPTILAPATTAMRRQPDLPEEWTPAASTRAGDGRHIPARCTGDV